jgi:hypothetical protein
MLHPFIHIPLWTLKFSPVVIQQVALFSEIVWLPLPKIGITNPIKQVSLIKMFIDGPEVSLKGSPTVSPVCWDAFERINHNTASKISLHYPKHLRHCFEKQPKVHQKQ